MIKFDFLNEVAIFSLAKYEQSVLFIFQATNESHARDRVLIEVRLTKKVKNLNRYYVNNLQVCINYGQVEATFEGNFTFKLLTD